MSHNAITQREQEAELSTTTPLDACGSTARFITRWYLDKSMEYKFENYLVVELSLVTRNWCFAGNLAV